MGDDPEQPANAWADLPTGDPAENLRTAFNCYEAALRVFSEKESPREWARIQDNLASVWVQLPASDGTTNLTSAIACYIAALRVYSEHESPQNTGPPSTQSRERMA